MNVKLLLPSIFCCVIFCTPPARYLLVTHDGLKGAIALAGSLPPKRYLLVPGEYRQHPLIFLDEEPSKSVIELIKAKKIKKAREFIENPNSEYDAQSVTFSRTLLCFFEGHYDSCVTFLEEFDAFSMNCFLPFISVDCELENDRIAGRVKYENYLDKYQKVLDCSSDDDLHKEIVRYRLKLIRYGY